MTNNTQQDPAMYNGAMMSAAQSPYTDPWQRPDSPYNTQAQSSYPGTGAPQGQPPKRKRSRRGLGVAALLLACTLAGAGGGYLAGSNAGEGDAPVIYRSPATNSAEPTGSGGEASVSDIAEIAGKSSVSITTGSTMQNPFQQGDAEGDSQVTGAGSGVVLSKDGFILTNSHVVEGADSIKVTLPDGTEYDAKLIGRDAQTDIAVLKIDADNLTPATVGDSEALKVGDFCLAVGNPLGTLGGSVTDGIISAKNRDIEIGGRTMNLLQTNAAVSPGNSGGGLFNGKGELIGIINAKSGAAEAEGIGFAIPINEAMDIVEELIQNGYVTGRPALGVSVQSLDEQQAALAGMEPGVYIVEITRGGAADKAGLQEGDRIVSADGTPVEVYGDLNEVLAEKQVGDTIVLGIQRGTQQSEVTLTLGEMQPDASAQ